MKSPRSKTNTTNPRKTFRILFIVLTLLLVSIISYNTFGWQSTNGVGQANGAEEKPASEDSKTVPALPAENKQTVAHKTIMVSGYKMKYPLNDNNQQVVVRPLYSVASDPSTVVMEVTYKPITDYFANNKIKADAQYVDSCKNHKSGWLSAGTPENTFGISHPYGYVEEPELKQKRAEVLVAKGKAVKLNNEVYLFAPVKQNESCSDIMYSKDLELKRALLLADRIEKRWLQSFKLVEGDNAYITIKEWGIRLPNNEYSTLSYRLDSSGQSLEFTSRDLPTTEFCNESLGVGLIRFKGGPAEYQDAEPKAIVNGYYYYVDGAPGACGDLAQKRIREIENSINNIQPTR